MTQLQIKQKIDELNDTIARIMQPNVFTLNNTILSLTNEIKDLQEKCTHTFVDGYCEYCYREKDNEGIEG